MGSADAAPVANTPATKIAERITITDPLFIDPSWLTIG
jgi:hypothetical protein